MSYIYMTKDEPLNFRVEIAPTFWTGEGLV